MVGTYIKPVNAFKKLEAARINATFPAFLKPPDGV